MLDRVRPETLPQLTQWLGRPIELVPYSLQQNLLQAALNDLFRQPLQERALDCLKGRYLEVAVQDLDLSWIITLRHGRLLVACRHLQPDVSIRANAHDLLRMAARREDPDTLFFQRRLVIEGDTELGLHIKNLMDSLDWNQLPRPARFLIEQAARWAV